MARLYLNPTPTPVLVQIIWIIFSAFLMVLIPFILVAAVNSADDNFFWLLNSSWMLSLALIAVLISVFFLGIGCSWGPIIPMAFLGSVVINFLPPYSHVHHDSRAYFILVFGFFWGAVIGMGLDLVLIRPAKVIRNIENSVPSHSEPESND